MLLRTDLIIDPSLRLLKEGVFSFRFGLESIGCSIYKKSAKSFGLENLNGPPCLPVKSVRILLYFEAMMCPRYWYDANKGVLSDRVFIAGREAKARGVEHVALNGKMEESLQRERFSKNRVRS